MTTQLDIFTDYDAQARRNELWQQPHTCPCCGTQEPNGFVLRNNHGIDPGEDAICGFPIGEHPNFGDLCVAQWLTRNHIAWAVEHDDDIERYVERGRQLGLDVDAILAELATPERPRVIDVETGERL